MADDDDYMDSEMQAKQRRLIMRITQGRLVQALVGWRNIAIRRKSRKTIFAAVKPFEPWSRTPEDVEALCAAVAGVPFYDSLPKQILLETVQRLHLMILDNEELHCPEADYKAFYVVMAGNLEVITDNYYRAAHEVSYSAGTEDGESGVPRRTTSTAGQSLNQSLSRQRSSSRRSLSAAGLFDMDEADDAADMFVDEMMSGGVSVREMRMRIRNASAAQAAHVSFQVLRAGDSFTGRLLDIRNKEKEASGYGPVKVLAATAEEHHSVALLKIPFDDFLVAAKRRSEAALLRRVEFCCAMPVLRHTPFKELHLLCSNMTEAVYDPGTFITCQGKEATHVHIILEGEVGIILDVFEKVKVDINAQDATPQRGGAPSAGRGAEGLQLKFAELIAKKTVTHALLAIRGPGAIIGDDSLRERYIAVNAVAKTAVRTMMVTAQKFKHCMDTLTVNRMAAFRQQLAAAEQTVLRDHVHVYHHNESDKAHLRHSTLQWALGKKTLPATLDRSPQRRFKTWRPNGGLGNGKGITSFDRIVAEQPLPRSDDGSVTTGGRDEAGSPTPSETSDIMTVATHGKGSRLDLKRWGLLAAANTMGLSSPSMDAFLKAVKVQVVAQQAELAKQHEESQKETLGFVFKPGQQNVAANRNVESESWIDCRDVMEEKLQAQKFTEMMETAVLLLVELVAVPGQGNMNSRRLCRACDEARIRWAASASRRGLQLSRVSPTRWYLHTALGEAGLRHRPVVREVAECALEMTTAWTQVVTETNILPHAFCAGLAVGSLFASYDGGKFLRELGGRTFDTASTLAAEAATSHPSDGGIFLTDTAVESLRHTHVVAMERTTYRLLAAVQFQYSHNVKSLLGREVDADPVSPGLLKVVPQPATRHNIGPLTIAPPTPPSAPPTPPTAPSSPGLHPRRVPLIGYHDSAVVTPGGFSKPFHAESHAITAPSTATARIEASRSQRRGLSLKVINENELSSDMPSSVIGGVEDGDPSTPMRLDAEVSHSSSVSSHNASLNRRHASLRKVGAQGNSSRRRDMPETAQPEAPVVMSHRHRKSAAPQVATAAALRGGPIVLRDEKLNRSALVGHATSRAARSVVREVMGSSSSTRNKNNNAATAGGTVVKSATTSQARQVVDDKDVDDEQPSVKMKLGDNIPSCEDDRGRRQRILSPTSRLGHSNQSVSKNRALPHGRSAAGPVKRHYNSLPNDAHRGRMFGLMPSTMSVLGAEDFAAYDDADDAAVHSDNGDDDHHNIDHELYDDEDVYFDDGASVASRATRASMRSRHSAGGASAYSRASRRSMAASHRSGAVSHRSFASSRRSGRTGIDLPAPSEKTTKAVKDPTEHLVTETSGPSTSPAHHPGSDLLDILRVSKDCGSSLGAAAYVSTVPIGTMVLLMSSAGLTELPPLGHLRYLEMLAASFNRLTRLPGSARCWAGLLKLQNLSLAHNQLEKLPLDMFDHLPLLRELNLGANRLTSCPSSLWALRNLSICCLSGNRLGELPSSVSRLVSLEQLHVGHNSLTSLPHEIGRLTTLQVLDVSGNKIGELPSEIGRLSALTSLDAADNELTELPGEAMSGLRALQRLVLSRNQLRHVWSAEVNAKLRALGNVAPSSLHSSPQVTPRDWAGSVVSNFSAAASSSTPRDGGEAGGDGEEVTAAELETMMQMMGERERVLCMATSDSELVGLPQLKVLLLDGNKLTSVPEWVPPGLQELNLASNRLTAVPEWFPVRMARMIRLLSLQHNLVSELPKSFRLLLGLEMLALRGNPLVSIDAGPLSSLYNNGATASELVRWLRSKPLRKLKLAVHLVQMGLKSSGLTGNDEPTDQRNQSDRE